MSDDLKQKIQTDFCTAEHESIYSDALKDTINTIEQAAYDCDWSVTLGKALEHGDGAMRHTIALITYDKAGELSEDYTPTPKMQQHLEALKAEHNFKEAQIRVVVSTLSLDRHVKINFDFDADTLNPATKKAALENLAQDRKERFSAPEYQELEQAISEILQSETLSAKIERGQSLELGESRYNVLKLENNQVKTDTGEYLNHASPAFAEFRKQQREKGMHDVCAVIDAPHADFYVFAEVAFVPPKPQNSGLWDRLKEKISP